jgi:hypothetical protein
LIVAAQAVQRVASASRNEDVSTVGAVNDSSHDSIPEIIGLRAKSTVWQRARRDLCAVGDLAKLTLRWPIYQEKILTLAGKICCPATKQQRKSQACQFAHGSTDYLQKAR